MEVRTSIDGSRALIAPKGKLTVRTSPDLSAAIDSLPDDVCDIDIDLTDVEYVASAGIRLFVSTDKLAVTRGGTMRLLSPSDEVVEALDITGLTEILAIVR